MRGWHRHQLGMLVATAVVLLALSACDRNAGTPAVDEPAAARTQEAQGHAEEIARGFVEAFGAFDAERAMTFVADGADLSGVIGSQVPRDSAGLSLMLSLLQAFGYEQTITSCRSSAIGSDTSIVCAFDFHAIRSDEMGRGPFTGSDFTFTVRDGEIVEAGLTWDVAQFSPQVWEPFRDWVSATHPKDLEVMYTGGGANFRLTEESIRLWKQRSREYVKEEAG